MASSASSARSTSTRAPCTRTPRRASPSTTATSGHGSKPSSPKTRNTAARSPTRAGRGAASSCASPKSFQASFNPSIEAPASASRRLRSALGGQARAATALPVARADRRTKALGVAPGRALPGLATARRCEAGRLQAAGMGRRRSRNEGKGRQGQGEKEKDDSLLHGVCSFRIRSFGFANELAFYRMKLLLARRKAIAREEARGTPAPLFHTVSSKVRRELWEAYAWFVAAFRDAAEKLRAGDRHAAFLTAHRRAIRTSTAARLVGGVSERSRKVHEN